MSDSDLPRQGSRMGDGKGNFLANNWDKVLTLVFGGLVGYFAAIQAVNNRLSDVSERVTKLELSQSSQWSPALADVEAHELKIVGLQNTIDNLKSQQELTDKIIEINTDQFQLQFEQVRAETFGALQKFLDEYRATITDAAAD